MEQVLVILAAFHIATAVIMYIKLPRMVPLFVAAMYHFGPTYMQTTFGPNKRRTYLLFLFITYLMSTVAATLLAVFFFRTVFGTVDEDAIMRAGRTTVLPYEEALRGRQ